MSATSGERDTRDTRARRNAWLLAAAAAGVYAVVILWYVSGGAG